MTKISQIKSAGPSYPEVVRFTQAATKPDFYRRKKLGLN